jgi:hypothetical protein
MKVPVESRCRAKFCAPVGVERLEERRLLSAGGVVGLAGLRIEDSVQVEIVRSAPISTSTVGEDQPAIRISGEGAGSTSTVSEDALASHAANGPDSASPEMSASTPGGESNRQDSADKVPSSSAGETESAALADAANSRVALALAVSARAGRGAGSKSGLHAPDDEGSGEPATVFASDEANVDGGETILSGASALSEDSAASPGFAAVSVSADSLAQGTVSQRPTVEEAVSEWEVRAPASSVPATLEQLGTPTNATAVSDLNVAPGVRLARDFRADAARVLLERESVAAALPGPCYAGLAGEFLPLDRVAFERAVDQFLDQFESIAADLVEFEPSADVLATMSIVAFSALACGVIIHQRRRSRHADEATPGDGAGFSYFTGLPHSWSWSIAKA